MKKLFLSLTLPILFTFNLINVNAQYKIGDPVEDFTLLNVDNKMVSLTDFPEADGFIVVFTCNHCPFAKMYENRIIELDKKYDEYGYPVIAIQPNDPTKVPEDSFVNMKARSDKMSYTFPYLYDETQEIAKAYGATKTPHVYVLDKVGEELILKYIGGIDDNPKEAEAVTKTYVEDAIEALIDGNEVPLSETKAIGCTIKWKNS
jgi:peroxiredoxin